VNPAGSPGQVRAGAQELAGLARDMIDLGQQLRVLVSAQVEGAGGWQGVAAKAFAGHSEKRRQVFELAGEALAESARVLEEYATRLERAQATCRQAEEQARGSGLAIVGDGVDAASLLPPDPHKLVAAADVTRQLAEAQAGGLWASAELASALQPPEQLAQKAAWLLGDRSGLTPGGFLRDFVGAPVTFFWEMGVSTDQVAGALLMAGLGDSSAVRKLGHEAEAALGYAEQHPSEAIQALLGTDQIQEAFREDHPGQALGLIGANLAMTLDPETGETRALKALQEEERVAREQQLADGRLAKFHAELVAMTPGTMLQALPGADRAHVDPRKFADYSMNPTHPQNRGKSTAFTALGYDVESAHGRLTASEDVVRQICSSLADAPAVVDQQTKFGPRYRVQTEIIGPNGRHATLVTMWQIDNGTDAPRLITTWMRVHQ
jgi:hypothetical protein